VDAQKLFDDRPQSHARQPQKSGTQFRVEDQLGVDPNLTQAGEVLAGRVQNPLGIGEGVVQFAEIADRRRIEQKGAGVAAVHLDQVGALGIREPGSPFRVDADRAGAGGDQSGGREVARTGVDHPVLFRVYGAALDEFAIIHVLLGVLTTY